jgi:hypothetical protein
VACRWPRGSAQIHTLRHRRHRDRLDAGEVLVLADLAAVGANVDEPTPALAASDPRPAIADEQKARLQRALAAGILGQVGPRRLAQRHPGFSHLWSGLNLAVPSRRFTDRRAAKNRIRQPAERKAQRCPRHPQK